jgi:hypothetical protein
LNIFFCGVFVRFSARKFENTRKKNVFAKTPVVSCHLGRITDICHFPFSIFPFDFCYRGFCFLNATPHEELKNTIKTFLEPKPEDLKKSQKTQKPKGQAGRYDDTPCVAFFL